jgi:glycosyltransferase involved in cell wall biosynthesis
LEASSSKNRFHVICLRDEGIYAEKIQDLGIPVTCLKLRASWSSSFAVLKLYRLIRKLKPQIIQTWMYHADLLGGLAASAAHIPVAWGVRHSNLEADGNKRSTLMVARLCALFSARIPDQIVSCSRRAIRTHQDFGYSGDFCFIPNGIDVNEYFPEPKDGGDVRAELGIPLPAPVIGNVGRLDPQKDHRTLLKGFALLAEAKPDARLLLIGGGLASGNPEFDQLPGTPSKAVAIKALGPRRDVPRLMRTMNVFALSSIGEGFPNAVAEAMASGVPCVVTDVGDAAEIVGDSGWVVPPRDERALASALDEALSEDPEQHSVRCQMARRRIEVNFSVDRMVEAYEKLWANIRGN